MATCSLILGQPGWNFLGQYIDRTRSYERGLDVGFMLLRLTEKYRDGFSPDLYEQNLAQILTLLLRMLDKMDRWEEFVRSFDVLLNNTNLSLVGYFSEESRPYHIRNGASPYLLGDVPGGFKLHFLYSLARRREIVGRKIAKTKAGKKRGNLYHRRQDQLSDEELQERVNFVIDFIRSVQNH